MRTEDAVLCVDVLEERYKQARAWSSGSARSRQGRWSPRDRLTVASHAAQEACLWADKASVINDWHERVLRHQSRLRLMILARAERGRRTGEGWPPGGGLVADRARVWTVDDEQGNTERCHQDAADESALAIREEAHGSDGDAQEGLALVREGASTGGSVGSSRQTAVRARLRATSAVDLRELASGLETGESGEGGRSGWWLGG